MSFYIQLNRFLKIIFSRTNIVFLTCFFITGCVSYNIDDLDKQVSAIMSRPGGGIDPIPEIKPYAAYVYESGKSGARNPFKRFYIQERSISLEEQQGRVDDG